jgi:hypothetical protein
MLQRRSRFYFSEETLGPECGSEVGVQDLDGNVALVPQVVRKVDSRHAADPDLSVDPVATLECASETRKDVAHLIASLRVIRRRSGTSGFVFVDRRAGVHVVNGEHFDIRRVEPEFPERGHRRIPH